MRGWLGVIVGVGLFAHGCGGKTKVGTADTSASSSGGSGGSSASLATTSVSTTSSSGGSRATTSGAGTPGVASTTSASAAGGDAAISTASSSDGTAGAAGSATTNLGFYCPTPYGDTPLYCDAGQQCVSCVSDDQFEFRCIPSERRDPEGFQNGIADCDSANAVIECDGPEDCFAGEFCVTQGRTWCASEPLFGNCCLSCDAPPECTFCHTDQDCGEAGVCEDEPLLGEEIDACAPKPCDDDAQCPAGYMCQRSRCRREE